MAEERQVIDGGHQQRRLILQAPNPIELLLEWVIVPPLVWASPEYQVVKESNVSTVIEQAAAAAAAAARITAALRLVLPEMAQWLSVSSDLQVVHHQPPSNWQAMLTYALTTGQASRREVAEYLHNLSAQQRQAGLFPPEWAQIETVAVLYRDKGHLHSGQEAFVMWLRASSAGRALGLSQLSRSTFQRWLKSYEQMVGEPVRPGRGNRKRRQL